MNQEKLANHYLQEALKIQLSSKSISSKYFDLKRLVEIIAFELTKNETLQFSNFFSKLSFICNQYHISTKIHSFRKTAQRVLSEKYEPSEHEYFTHFKYVIEFISGLYDVLIPAEIVYFFPEKEYYTNKILSRNRVKKLRVQVIEIKRDCLICDHEENESDEYITIQIDEDGVNEIFISPSDFWVGAQLNLVNSTIDEEGIYHPRFIILEPDYLVDISAIAECFQDYGTTELHYIQKKFEEVPNSKHIRLGNFANSVVDHFCTENIEKTDFNELFKNDFKNYPLEYTSCKDLTNPQNLKEYYEDAKGHFHRLQKVLLEDFSHYNISLDRALLEPSFLCEQYGIQGRLDLLDLNDDGTNKIIELKSGGAPFPDDGKSIKPNHATQLFLYYQIIGVLYELEFKDITKNTEGFILYSKVYQGNLRFEVPSLKRVQRIFELRNQIIINENRLATKTDKEIENLLYNIKPANFIKRKINPRFRELLEEQLEKFIYPIRTSSPLQKAYFYSFANFIAKEQYMAKLGLSQSTTNNGLASLWLNSFEEKNNNFEIIYDLEIVENNISDIKKEIKLKRTNISNDFISIREGDICILYPRNKSNDSVLTNQVFKCTIKSISREYIVLRFRYQQPNTRFFDSFDKNGKWALERDFMDSSFTSMYRNLYSFMQSSTQKKELILTQTTPKSKVNYSYHNELLSEEQNRILSKALSANDYFLLNGPPGTGKTSIIIKELVKEIFEKQSSNILLLAYTNRAVDELCEAINTAISDEIEQKFIRIGSELSTSTAFHKNLLNKIIEQKDHELEEKGEKFSRKTIQDIINNQRIFVSTVASISSKNDILKLKKFDTIIIDEASQILEPQIVGILPKAERFIMIGDHKQLPAIVLQSPELAKTNNELLESIGLMNRKNSIFERLYEFCEKNKIENAFDQLTYQGRMHAEIADFPNQYFYDGKLNVAFDIPNLNDGVKQSLERQRADLYFINHDITNEFQQFIINNRFAYINVDENPYLAPTNIQEADLIVQFVQEIISLYELNNKEFDPKKTIGIIAPFRNQIALIKQKLELANIPNHEQITVDTVERYQGSQRDIILYSFAVTYSSQLNALVNMNDDGNVDRKLNVALTRAKEQLFLIGNQTILKENAIIKTLIEYLEKKTANRLII
ncbi:DNA replication ATP-dependent helicase Dna2 [Chishuiella changwenlii]|uniref:DNA helicase n=1 Tax=Chishuiella changwenlii TaxID=1434701 RepID=A0A1M7AI58_9FLAO|nr:AAA domain-containing protein [Chishuiella changwenlii]GGE90378.1 DNA helicase [Chishuiella changwenlii]SHL42432.1 DNA replication ATP-dependent helicase Dna2 [Chishuiella changwenlii]